MYKENNIYLGTNGNKYMYIGEYNTYIHTKKGPHLPEMNNSKKFYGIDKDGNVFDSSNPLIIYSIKSKEKKPMFIRNINESNPSIVSDKIIKRNLNGVSYPANEKEIAKAKELINESLRLNDISDKPINEYIKVSKRNIVTKNNRFFKLIINVNDDGTFRATLNNKDLPNVFDDELLSKITRDAFEKNIKNNTNMGLGGWNPYYESWEEAFKEMDDYLRKNNYTPVNIFYSNNNGKLFTINDFH